MKNDTMTLFVKGFLTLVTFMLGFYAFTLPLQGLQKLLIIIAVISGVYVIYTMGDTGGAGF